jgi:uncharacterized DUF497 family protein
LAKFRFIEWLIDWLEKQRSFAFEWDFGNTTKSLFKHGISCEEAESVFFQPETIRILGEQVSPPVNEPRYGLFGLTIKGRPVFVCFTLRGSGVRIISIRELNRKEKQVYADLCQK